MPGRYLQGFGRVCVTGDCDQHKQKRESVKNADSAGSIGTRCTYMLKLMPGR